MSRHYWEYESQQAYREGRRDESSWRGNNYDYDKYSDRERDRAYRKTSKSSTMNNN